MSEKRGALKFVLATLAFLLPIGAALAIVLATASGSNEPTSVVDGTVHTFQIPAGTADLMRRGLLTDDLLPEQYTIARGDTIVVINNDAEVHTYGPFTVRPGETQRMTFTEPGYFFGVCTVGDHETATITVT